MRHDEEIEELDAANEFRVCPFAHTAYDLSRHGLPWIPVVGRASFRKYRFPEPRHVHKGCTEVIYCLSGACEYESGDQAYSLRPGRVFVSRSTEPHRAIGNPRGYSYCYLMLKNPGRRAKGRHVDSAEEEFDWLGREFQRLPRLFKGGAATSGRFNRLFALLEAADMPEPARRIRMRAAVMTLLLGLLDSTALSLNGSTSERLAGVAEEMRRHPERDYPLDALAMRLGLSPSALLNGFKDVTGFPPHAYLMNCRIEQAKRALSSGPTVKEVASRLGYPSAQHFSSSFKSATGLTPGEWRRRRSS